MYSKYNKQHLKAECFLINFSHSESVSTILGSGQVTLVPLTFHEANYLTSWEERIFFIHKMTQIIFALITSWRFNLFNGFKFYKVVFFKTNMQ